MGGGAGVGWGRNPEKYSGASRGSHSAGEIRFLLMTCLSLSKSLTARCRGGTH